MDNEHVDRPASDGNGVGSDAVLDRPADAVGAASESAAAAEPVAEETAAPTGPRCPWCSAPLPETVEVCPSCGAVLTPTAEAEIDGIPGVTEVDPKLRDYKPKPQKPQLIVDFLIQYVEEDETAAAARQRLIRVPKKRKKEGDSAPTPESAPPSEG